MVYCTVHIRHKINHISSISNMLTSPTTLTYYTHPHRPITTHTNWFLAAHVAGETTHYSDANQPQGEKQDKVSTILAQQGECRVWSIHCHYHWPAGSGRLHHQTLHTHCKSVNAFITINYVWYQNIWGVVLLFLKNNPSSILVQWCNPVLTQ